MIEGEKGFIVLSNEKAECKISLFGGNVVSYRPKKEEKDVFWVAEKNKFDNVHAIRGGIPVCWPRFSEEKLNDNLPRHGFARLSMWNLDKVSVSENLIEVVLSLNPDEKYNLEVCAKLYVKITDVFECCLETINNSDKDFKFSEALHSYFYVGDRDQTKIKGFNGYKYKNLSNNKIEFMQSDIVITEEFDNAFMNHTNKVEIEDAVLRRKIIMEKSGSNSTVVWNPDKDLAEMSKGQYKNFVCVEAANQGDCFAIVGPKKTHMMSMKVCVKKI